MSVEAYRASNVALLIIVTDAPVLISICTSWPLMVKGIRQGGWIGWHDMTGNRVYSSGPRVAWPTTALAVLPLV